MVQLPYHTNKCKKIPCKSFRELTPATIFKEMRVFNFQSLSLLCRLSLEENDVPRGNITKDI